METRKNRKIRMALVAAAGVFLAGIVAFVAVALRGTVMSDQAKAMKLLAQLPEKFSHLSTSECIGLDELKSAWEKEGGMRKVTISDLHVGEGVTIPSWPGLPGSDLSFEQLWERDGSLCQYSASAKKKNKKLSCTLYHKKGKETIAVLPELLPARAVLWKHNSKKKDFLKTCRDGMSVEALQQRGKEGYKITVPKETVNRILKDSIPTVRTAFLSFSPNSSRDWVLDLYENDGQLTGMSGTLEISGIPVQFTMAFSDEGKEKKVSLDVNVVYRGEKLTFDVVAEDIEDKNNATTVNIQMGLPGKRTGSLTVSEVIDPSDNSVSVNGEVSCSEREIVSLIAIGTIKDLNEGKTANYSFDQVEVSVGERDFVSCSMDVMLGVLEHDIKIPDKDYLDMNKDGKRIIAKIKDTAKRKLAEW